MKSVCCCCCCCCCDRIAIAMPVCRAKAVQKYVTMWTFQLRKCTPKKKRQQHHNQPYVDLYPPQSIFNEAMKKAFQWWILCSSLDTSNFISHRLSSTSINVHTLSEWRRERVNGRDRDDIYSIGKESDFYLKRKCLALQLQNRYRFKCCVSPGSDGSAAVAAAAAAWWRYQHHF